MPFDIRTLATNETTFRLDPFLALIERGPGGPIRLLETDESDAEFECLNYVIAGAVSSRDRSGRETIVRAGGVEWIGSESTAEYASSSADAAGGADALHVISIRLRSAPGAKPARPRYQAFDAEELPVRTARGSWVRIIAGAFDGNRSPLDTVNSPLIAHVRLDARADIAFPLEPGETTLIYAMNGSAQIGPQRIVAGELASSRSVRSYVAFGAQNSSFEALVLSAVAVTSEISTEDDGARGFAKLAAIV